MPLDPAGVVEVALDAMSFLGYPDSGLFALEEDGAHPRTVSARGEPFDPVGAIGAVVGSGTSVVAGQMSAAPVWVDGWLSAVLVGVRDPDGRPVDEDVEALGLLAVATGAALQNAQRFELERRTVERLEQLDRMKNDFLASVSHELRTPLTAIQGMGLTLERSWRELDDDTRSGFLRSLNERAVALGEIVDGLLDLSDLDAARARLQVESVELSELLGVAVTRFANAQQGRTVRSEIAPGLRVRGDARLLDRVIDQLLSNAAKHTLEGTTVTVSAARADDTTIVSVADDGPGLAPDDLARVGERFHKGGDLNERARGLGLGLALAAEILTLHDSWLEVESEPGSGARFWFALPSVG
jgi:signal transduction histidine kinase